MHQYNRVAGVRHELDKLVVGKRAASGCKAASIPPSVSDWALSLGASGLHVLPQRLDVIRCSARALRQSPDLADDAFLISSGIRN